MTARTAAAAASFALALTLGACTNFYEVPIETPIQPKMDVSAFQRVLIAGFLAGGSEDVDANLETVRLLRSQLRSKSSLRVIDADVLPLIELAKEQGDKPSNAPGTGETGSTSEGTPPPPANPAPANTPPQPANTPPQPANTPPQTSTAAGTNGKQAATPNEKQAAGPNEPAARIKDEKDLQPLEGIFANVDFWKKIGEEYQNPLIVTGSVLFSAHARSGFVQREQEVYDAYGRRRVVPVRTYMERKGFILQPKFVFIDGRTGTTIYSESFKEEVLYSPQQSTPALSSYFELMDRLVPSFLSTLSSQKIKGSRILLK